MYVRLARFVGADPAVLERELEGMRAQLEGESTEDPSGQVGSDELDLLRETIRRVLVLADREQGSSAMLAFCETEDDVRRVDELFDRMSPSEGGGRRQSVDIYEVQIEKQF